MYWMVLAITTLSLVTNCTHSELSTAASTQLDQEKSGSLGTINPMFGGFEAELRLCYLFKKSK